MKSNYFHLLIGAFIVHLLHSYGGVRILTHSLVLLFGTALPIQLLIYSCLRLRILHSTRERFSTIFMRLPMALGFSILVVSGVVAVLAEVFLLRDFFHPSDSWLMIVLGFLLGIMGPVWHCNKLRSRQLG